MNLVKYMGANQGGLFLVVEEGNRKYISMEACYAFDRKKFLHKTLEIGEGLVGQTYLEKQTIFLTTIPERYVTITSGLGSSAPQCLLVVPFILNDNVECIIELASFTQFKQYQLEFIEKLGESIASNISNMRINANTRRLLEETQTTTEELKAQEEEMRQNMEELTATQEEMARKEKELSKLLEMSDVSKHELQIKIEEVERLKEENQRETAKMLEYQEKYKQDIIGVLNELPAKVFVKDSKGYMILCNKVVADSYNLPVEQILGTHDKDHFGEEQAKEWAAQEAEIIKEGGRTFVQEERLHDKVRYLKTTKMPFYIQHLDELGLMGFQIDVTDSYKAEKNMQKV
jgi:PAS domain-containing protein